MNARIKKLWVKALRSGKYQQAQGSLRSFPEKGSSFCCLGVLCELYAKEHKELDGIGGWVFNEERLPTFMGEYALLPMPVVQWAGVPDQKCTVHVMTSAAHGPMALSERNDTGHRFSDIADFIEAYL